MGLQARLVDFVIPRPSRISHPSLVVAASALLPGLGHLLMGWWSRGLVMMAPLLLVAAATAVLTRLGRAELAALALSPRLLWVALAADMALLLWRLVVVFDAYRLSRYRHPSSVGLAAAGSLAIAALFVAVPHLVVGSGALAAADLVTSVFQPPPAVVRTPRVPARVLSDGLTTTLPAPSTTESLSGEPTTVPGTFVAALPPLPAFDEQEALTEALVGINPLLRGDPVTILLVGTDAGPGRRGFRTDTMMVVSIDPQTDQALMFGFPRNMSWVPLPARLADRVEGECKCFPEQLNHLYVRSSNWSDVFPNEVDPGMATLREVLAYLLGIPIDYYVRVDMRGFVQIIDSLGGVTITARTSIWDRVSPIREDEEWIEVDVSPGRNHLNGREALAYVRSRHGSSDYNRMARQRCVLSALAARADPVRVLARLPRIAAAIKQNTVTDIDQSLLPQLALLASRIDAEDIATIAFVPDYFVSEVRDGRWAPDVGKIRSTVQEMLAGDYESPLVASGGQSECGA